MRCGRPVVVGELDALRIDHEEAHLLRRVVQQDAVDDGIHADRLARTGGARDEQMRHADEIGGDRAAIDALAEGDGQR